MSRLYRLAVRLRLRVDVAGEYDRRTHKRERLLLAAKLGSDELAKSLQSFAAAVRKDLYAQLGEAFRKIEQTMPQPRLRRGGIVRNQTPTATPTSTPTQTRSADPLLP